MPAISGTQFANVPRVSAIHESGATRETLRDPIEVTAMPNCFFGYFRIFSEFIESFNMINEVPNLSEEPVSHCNWSDIRIFANSNINYKDKFFVICMAEKI